MISLDTVVLPQPLSPTRPRHFPRRISKLTSSTASLVPPDPPPSPLLRSRKRFVRPVTLSSGPAADLETYVIDGQFGSARSPAEPALAKPETLCQTSHLKQRPGGGSRNLRHRRPVWFRPIPRRARSCEAGNALSDQSP